MSTVEDRALGVLTSARPAELAAALGPRLSAAVSVDLVDRDETRLATAAGLAAAGVAGPRADAVEVRPTDAEAWAAGVGMRAADESGVVGRRLTAVPDPVPDARPAVPVGTGLWLEVGALIPEVARRRRHPGRRRRDDRRVLEGILHVLATGIGWRELPQDLGCGSGVTCWRRLHEWVDGGTWGAIEPVLRAALDPGSGVDWDRPWAGTGRSPLTSAATRPRSATADPGATPAAVARRRAWTGPSRV